MNYADDTTFNVCDLDLKSLLTRLEHDAALVIEWFELNGSRKIALEENYPPALTLALILNQTLTLTGWQFSGHRIELYETESICHFLFSGHKYETLFFNVGKTKIWESKQQKLLGILTDWDLKFDEYVLSQCKKAGKKLIALVRISKFMTFGQRRNIVKAFIESQLGHCPLVWMFCGRQTNARINRIRESALRAVYNDEICSFEELLGRDKSETIHRRNIKILAAELFKIKNGHSNDIMTQLICKRNSTDYSLRLQTGFSLPEVTSVNYGVKGLRYFLMILKTIEYFENSQIRLSHGFLETVLVESTKITYIE